MGKGLAAVGAWVLTHPGGPWGHPTASPHPAPRRALPCSGGGGGGGGTWLGEALGRPCDLSVPLSARVRGLTGSNSGPAPYLNDTLPPRKPGGRRRPLGGAAWVGLVYPQRKAGSGALRRRGPRLLRAGVRPSRLRQRTGRLLTLCKTLNHSLHAAAASIENITSGASGNQ